MRIGIALLVLAAACGRSGFGMGIDAAPEPDFTPDPIDWSDFTTLSDTKSFDGINQPLNLVVSATYATGTPTIEMSLAAGSWNYLTPAQPLVVMVQPGGTMQFRVLGNFGDSAIITVTNESASGTLIDTVKGTAGSMVTGDGTAGSPYTAPSPPADCAEFLAMYPEQDGRDGLYQIAPFVADCDMTNDGGGWTLAARILAASANHSVVTAIGTLTDRAQATTAKLADTAINGLGFTKVRINIETVGTVYGNATTLDLDGNPGFSTANSAAPAIGGPYSYTFYSSVGCSSDCGVALAQQDMGFGVRCGYQFWASSGTRRPGMGCQGNFGKNGTLWVR